jgi:(p)ppGpp synthase/HD superfamily hydrolase
MDITERALRFASKAHAEQKRKYTNEPYIVHPVAVANIVRSVPHTDEMIAAAYLHDVVEDCGVAPSFIYDTFGNEVYTLVAWLTDVSRPEDGNRFTRKKLDREHSALAPPEAQTIKLADLIDNTASITKYDPNFAVAYITEKWLLLEVMDKGDPVLYKRAWDLVLNWEKTLP